MEELITIIVPVYKVEGLIHRCLNSIQSQTYKNIEVILVDDGSPDHCGEICDLYEKSDCRFKVIHKANGGLSDARNHGLDIARGDYILFVDSDDWIHKQHVEKLYQLMKETDSEIAVCNFTKYAEKVRKAKNRNSEDLKSGNQKSDYTEENIYQYTNIEALMELMGNFSIQMVVAWGKLYKRELFHKLRFPVGRLHEDVFITYKLIYRAKRIVLTTAPLYYYWQRADSITGAGLNRKGYIDRMDAYLGRAGFFNLIGLTELSSRQYRLIFLNYMKDRENIIRAFDSDMNDIFDQKLKELRFCLRKSNQRPAVRLFVEIYFIFPDLLSKLYDRYTYKNRRIKKPINST
jgi:glycosyltransferase involved in cell wall biosynthesis